MLDKTQIKLIIKALKLLLESTTDYDEQIGLEDLIDYYENI